jgi:hypothetical protein
VRFNLYLSPSLFNRFSRPTSEMQSSPSQAFSKPKKPKSTFVCHGENLARQVEVLTTIAIFELSQIRIPTDSPSIFIEASTLRLGPVGALMVFCPRERREDRVGCWYAEAPETARRIATPENFIFAVMCVLFLLKNQQVRPFGRIASSSYARRNERTNVVKAGRRTQSNNDSAE